MLPLIYLGHTHKKNNSIVYHDIQRHMADLISLIMAKAKNEHFVDTKNRIHRLKPYDFGKCDYISCLMAEAQ